MSAEIIKFDTGGVVGDGVALCPDGILDAHKGRAVKLALVMIDADGNYEVAGSHGAAESLLLLSYGAHFLIENEVGR